jgi:hypothetical protein|tara:strand:- start:278 stop:526 length:249 start_codon:yes stop_codon:yes gene_type:complete
MSKKGNFYQQELGLDEKTSEAIRLLMDEGLLEPLLIDLRNALEAEEFQNSTKPSGIKFDPLKEDLIRHGFTPEEAEEWLQMI